MSKPVVLACIAIMCYAVQNNLLEQKLTKYNAVVILLVTYLVMLPLALARFSQLRLAGEVLLLPSGLLLWLTLFAGLLWFTGDYLYVTAFTSGGDLITITTIVAMYPVAASVVKFFWVGGVPNRYQIISYLFAAIAVYFAGKGSILPTP